LLQVICGIGILATKKRARCELFKSPNHIARFNKLKQKKFVSEKAFTLYEDTISGVQEELEIRGCIKLNGLVCAANCSMAVEFLANAYQECDHDPMFETTVRGVEVKFDEETINNLLGTKSPLVCGVEKKRNELEMITTMEQIGELERIKDELCIENTPWLKYTKGFLPTKFGLNYMKPLARTWATFFVHKLESCGNSSEFRLVKAVGVQAIMKGEEINVGRLVANDLWRIANETKDTFTLGHCSIIRSLCKDVGVDVMRNDMVLKKGSNINETWMKRIKNNLANRIREERVVL